MKQQNFLIVALSISILFFSCSKDDGSLAESDDGSIHATGTTQVTGVTPINYSTRISIQNSAFTPAEVTVMVGGSILWINNDNTVHTVTADDGSFDSGDLQPSASVGFTFNTVGPHPYHCKYHREMTGIVKCVTK
ncbi:MAG TPA: cupredoxin domain-containing protein [Chitinophagaceae bacterium]|jgi:plastocyanin|nr:cupredoxin domain-containing protein [Chitinophagaceae bacterium]